MQVLVLGGGYAGLTLTRGLEDRLGEEHDLVLVDEDGTHLVQHELHRVVRRPDLAGEITVDLEAVLDRAAVREGRVETLDAEERTVELADGTELDYDVCAVCLGAEPALQVEGVREHATPLKRIEHARAIHEEAVSVLDGGAADGPAVEDTAARSDGEPPRIVVVGAGLSGVQVAGELATLAEARDRTVGEDVELALLEQLGSVAPGFGEAFQGAVHGALAERSVEIRTDAAVDRVGEDALELADGTTLAYDQLVWTGGIAGASALGGERPQVDARLLLADRTFGVGDAVRAVDREGQAVPATAQAAVREAETVAGNVAKLVAGGDGVFEPRLDRFTFESPGWVVSVGDGAVAKVGPTVVTGSAAVALKTTVGVGYLSSVGALREAVDLVNGELGLRVGED